MRRLIAHLAGDFIWQSRWMAETKTRRDREGVRAATWHAVLYTAAFVPFTRNPLRLAVIGVTHGLLDHYRPLPKILAVKDTLFSPWSEPLRRPDEVPFWLHVLVDNTIHLAVNEMALDAWRRR